MILYKAIKYKIIDYAIAIFLNSIIRSIFLNLKLVPLEDVYPGQEFSKIYTAEMEYSGCKIIDINKAMEYDGKVCYIIRFSYRSIKMDNFGVAWNTSSGYDALYDYQEERIFKFLP